MTDKIIIDGCNVSGCEHYKTGDCLISPVWCDQFYNCDYKQLKRKEQECETLASQLDFEAQKKECLEQECEEWKNKLAKSFTDERKKEIIIDQLKAENEQLKKELFSFMNGNYCANHCSLKQLFDHLKAENNELKDLITRLDNQRETYWKEYQKLKQALTDIKEIAEDYCKTCIVKLLAENETDCKRCWKTKILQKISEVQVSK